MKRSQSGASRCWWYGLLLLPFIFMLWVPSFNSMDPKLAGIPFFYWYQFVWIALTAVIVAIVYFMAHGKHR